MVNKLLLVIAGMAIGIVAGGYFARAEFTTDTAPGRKMFSEDEQIANSEPGKRPPRVVIVSGEQYQFGTMQRWATQSHDFVLRNEGDLPLTLEAGETSCKCTLSELKDGKLPAGESTIVTLTWTAKTHEPKFHQSAEIRTNDPLNPAIRLIVHGDVVESVWYDPREVVVNNLVNGEKGTFPVRILCSRDEKFELTGFEWTVPDPEVNFDVQFSPLPPDVVAEYGQAKSGVLVSLIAKEDMKLGRFEHLLRLKCNLADVPTMDLGVRGSVVGDISIAGPKYSPTANRLDLSTFDQATGAASTLYVSVKGANREKIEVKIASVEPAGILEATLEEPDPKVTNIKRMPLKVKIAPGASLGDYTGNGANKPGKIILETTHPTIKHLELKVVFVVK